MLLLKVEVVQVEMKMVVTAEEAGCCEQAVVSALLRTLEEVVEEVLTGCLVLEAAVVLALGLGEEAVAPRARGCL